MSSLLKTLNSARTFALALTFAFVVVAARGEIKVGDAFPLLNAPGMTNLAGGDLPAVAGKVVLVDFWASWCAPCKASFPAMGRLHQAFSAQGLVVVAISVDDKPAAATAFWKRLAPPFATLHDRDRSLVEQVIVPAMPTSYLVGRDGRVRFIHRGFRGEATERELREQVQILLTETLTSTP